jgi:hypothetical protein
VLSLRPSGRRFLSEAMSARQFGRREVGGKGLLPSFPFGEPPRLAFVCPKSEETVASLTRPAGSPTSRHQLPGFYWPPKGISSPDGFHREVLNRKCRQTAWLRALPAQEGRRGDPQIGRCEALRGFPPKSAGPADERCLPLLHSSSAPEALSADYGHRPAFWPQGQFSPDYIPFSRANTGEFRYSFRSPLCRRPPCGLRRASGLDYLGSSKLTSTFCSSMRSSTSAAEVSARLSASSRGAEKLRGHSRRARTTLISAASRVICAPR